MYEHVTIKNFKYVPTKSTKKEIWKYLNAANLIELEDISDKKKSLPTGKDIVHKFHDDYERVRHTNHYCDISDASADSLPASLDWI